jgi:hypothetical protein
MNKKVIVMGLSGLTLLLSACEKEMSEVGSGEKVEIFLSAGSAGYGAGDEVLRRVQDWTPETVIVPLEDNLYLSATLVPDAVEDLVSDELRAALANNQRIRFAAYNGASQVGIATYSYSTGTGKFTPVGNPLGVEPTGTTYRFTAHSYFNSATTPAEANIAPSADLVWGYKDQAVNATWNSRIVDINMAHKFSRVRVQVKAGAITNTTVTNISGVEIEGGRNASFSSLREGTLTTAGAVTQAIADNTFTGKGTATVTSGYYSFYPSPTTVKIGNLSLNVDGEAKAYTGLSADFTKTLSSATSYTLVVGLKAGTLWAHSNIYWEPTLNGGTGGLMFDKTPTVPSHANYNGVCFQWGSLIGISSAASSSIIYIPNVGAGTWDGTKRWDSSGLPWGAGSYANIPRIPGPGVGNSEENYLYNLGTSVFSSYTGDICSYLTDGSWRMPNKAEFGVPADYNPSTYTEGADPNDPTGKGSLGSAGVTYNTASGAVFFPASGYRGSTGQWGGFVASNIMYWTGMGSWDNGYTFAFKSGAVSPHLLTNSDPRNGFLVRCVKN